MIAKYLNHLREKFTTSIIFTMALFSLLFAGHTLALAAPLSLQNSDLQARLTLDPTLKPDNSPGTIIDSKALNGDGGEAVAGNFLLQLIAGALISIAAPVAIAIIAVAGLIAVVSHGDQKLIDMAKQALTYAIVGLVVIIFSWVITRSIISLVISANAEPAAAPTQNSAAPPPGK